MKISSPISTLCTGALALVSASLAEAQNSPPFPGYLNEYLRQQSPDFKAWDIGGDDRVRYESKQGMAVGGVAGSVDFRSKGAEVNNDYLMNRLRLHVGYSDKWWNVFAEAQSSVVVGDDRFAYANNPAIPGTVKRKGDGPESDTLDLHQAYVSLGNFKEFPLGLKVGRQELSYGEERLIGAFGWNNIGRVFDAAKLRWQNDWFGADFFTSHVVIPEDRRFDVDNSRDWFSGIYATTDRVPNHSIDVYLLSRNASRTAISEEPSPQFGQPTARDIYTVGGRVKSKPGAIGGFDYLIDGAYQFGRFAPTAAAASLTQDAYMFVAQGGYTFTNQWAKPRLGVEYAFGSGDHNSTDKTHGTFENLFPTNHRFYGFMDLVALQNIHDIRSSLQLKPTRRSGLSVEGHAFWLADAHDYFYAVTGAPRTAAGYGLHSGYSTFVGTELDVIGTYRLTRSAQLEGGYGHFFTGSYVQSSLAGVGGDRDANWIYAQMTLKF